MPELTPESIGIWVVAAIVIFHFLFQLARHRREETDRVQAKISPPVHEQIENRVKTTEEFFGKEVDKLHGRISGLRSEIKEDLEKSTDEVRTAMKDVRTMYTSTSGDMREMKATVEQLNQRTHSLEGKLDHHIEKKHAT